MSIFVGEPNENLKVPDFDCKYCYSDYVDRVEADFSVVSGFFPLLKMVKLPTKNPMEIYLTGRLVPYGMLASDHLDVVSFDIVAFYPSGFHDNEIYVIDKRGAIVWERLPQKHRHYRTVEEKTVLCTHHPEELKHLKNVERSVAILFSAWKLFIQYKRYIREGVWVLEELEHGYRGTH